jgi:hypothetical protein
MKIDIMQANVTSRRRVSWMVAWGEMADMIPGTRCLILPGGGRRQ